jgi:hypothetical protein
MGRGIEPSRNVHELSAPRAHAKQVTRARVLKQYTQQPGTAVTRRTRASFVLAVVSASVIGLLFAMANTQPWSSVHIVAQNYTPFDALATISADGEFVDEVLVKAMSELHFPIPFAPGGHSVSIDVSFGMDGRSLDGHEDWSSSVRVGVLKVEHVTVDLEEFWYL